MVKLRGREDYPIYFGARPEILKIAGELRREMTPAEMALWERLRNRQLKGFRFRRQHPIHEFIVDFFSYEAMLVIEIDGEVHDEPYQKERDKERADILKQFGIREIRFTNQDVLQNVENVLIKIEQLLP